MAHALNVHAPGERLAMDGEAGAETESERLARDGIHGARHGTKQMDAASGRFTLWLAKFPLPVGGCKVRI